MMKSFFSVTVLSNEPHFVGEFEPWVSVFETREEADAFEARLRDIMSLHANGWMYKISRDSGAIGQTTYANCLEAELNDDDDDEEE